MEKRALIAVVLSVAVFYVFSFFMPPQKQADKPLQSTSGQQQSVVVSNQPTQTQQVKPLLNQSQAPTVSASQLVSVETDLYSAVFNTSGASLKSLSLKKYKESNAKDAKQVVLALNADPAEPVMSTKASGFSLSPVSPYSVDNTNIKIERGKKQQLVFTHVSAQGYVVRKTYTFDGSGYGISLDTELINNTPSPISGSFQQLITAPYQYNEKDPRYENYGSTVYADNSLHTDPPKEFSSAAKKYEKFVQWAGITDKYFLIALISDKSSIASVEIKKNQAGFLESSSYSPAFTAAPGQSVKFTDRFFAGPKDIDVLKAQGSSLEQSLDLGWFAVLAKPMLHSLKFFYGYVHNYGLAIIIITIILKVLFFPLTHKSYKSMKDMGKLQPKMAALKEKYKNDRDAMNKAVMELYREHKVNPLGGCLPMVVQIPVFFALYKALMFSIELRHAPFYFWIMDLSDKDPYYVTPIVMGVTMFIQQKMTPSTMDEMQQKIMLALPVVFTFMFLTFPSGLVLYWLVNNILTILQQMYINKIVK